LAEHGKKRARHHISAVRVPYEGSGGGSTFLVIDTTESLEEFLAASAAKPELWSGQSTLLTPASRR
jgi:hypothetical protein